MGDGENPAKEKGVLSSNDSDDDIIGYRWIERRSYDDYDISKDIGLGSFVPSDSDDDIIRYRWIERRSYDDYDITKDIGLGSFVPSDSDDDIIRYRWIERRSYDDYDISKDIGLGSFVPSDSDDDIIGNRWIERRSFDDYDISQDIGLGRRSSDADEHIEDMGFTVGSYMHIHEDTGCVIGGIKFLDRHLNVTDCTQFKVANIPLDVDGIKVTNFSAKFILLVEKIDLAMRLRTSRFYSQFPCVIVATMGRAPDYSTKKFLYLLNKGGGLKLQLFALLDCIPRSIKTMSDLIHYGHLDINWLGIQPCHVPRLIKARVLAGHMIHEKFNENECSDLLELSLQRLDHRPFRGQLRLMSGKVPYKVPVEALSYDYLIDCYLPPKLEKYGLRVPATK